MTGPSFVSSEGASAATAAPAAGAEPPLLPQLAELLHRPVPEELLPRARLHLLDWLGCAVQGHGQIGAALHDALRAGGRPPGPCSALFGGTTHWTCALQVNAALGNVAEMDDLHREAVLHPGMVVVPTVLAAAQTLQSPLDEALRALVRGYETAIRLGRTLGPGHYAHFHNTATAGAPAAAAAVASLLGLDPRQTVWAIANAASVTGGLWQMRHEPVLTKQWHGVAAAVQGSMAAWLAQAGVSGPASVLEGVQGLYAATAPDARPQRLLEEPGQWLLEQCSFKPWPACRFTHPCIDAALQVRGQLPEGAGADDIASAQVHTHADAIKFCDNPSPQTELQAKFSLQHCAALALSGGGLDFADFRPQSPGFARLQPLRDRVQVVQDAEFTAAYPGHYGAQVQARTASGQEFSARVRDAWGDPEIPMDKEQVCEKARRMMREGGLDEARAEALLQWALHGADAGAELLA